MLELLAQTYSTYDTTTLTTSNSAGTALFGGLFMLWALVVLAIAIVAIVAMWKIFVKAGVEGWKSIIPVYNTYTLAEISGKPGWWGLLIALIGFVAWVPIIGWLAWIGAIVLYVLIALELAKKFGKDTTFAVLWLIIFSLVGMLILGFGDAEYEGAKTKKATSGDVKPLGSPKSTE